MADPLGCARDLTEWGNREAIKACGENRWDATAAPTATARRPALGRDIDFQTGNCTFGVPKAARPAFTRSRRPRRTPAARRPQAPVTAFVSERIRRRGYQRIIVRACEARRASPFPSMHTPRIPAARKLSQTMARWGNRIWPQAHFSSDDWSKGFQVFGTTPDAQRCVPAPAEEA